MDEKELHDRGLKLRVEMFGRDAVEKRVNALGESLQTPAVTLYIINAHVCRAGDDVGSALRYWQLDQVTGDGGDDGSGWTSRTGSARASARRVEERLQTPRNPGSAVTADIVLRGIYVLRQSFYRIAMASPARASRRAYDTGASVGRVSHG